MATGIVQAAWVLRRIHRRLPETELFLRWEQFAAAQRGLLIWEAFVTRDAKGPTDEEDAKIGVKAFCAQLPDVGDPAADETESTFCLAGAIAMWAGWVLDFEDLRKPCVLVRA